MYILPNAKINIGLNITARRPDGYHNLQTVFYPIPLTDSIKLTPLENSDDSYEFMTSNIQIPGEVEENIVVRVFLSMQKEFNLPPTSIHLAKRIPVGAGLGGGSSDAAFMMKLLNEYYSIGLSDDDMEKRLSSFGADCPFFVRNKPVYAEGIGNEFQPINISLKGYFLLLVKPSVHVSTAEAYAGVTPTVPNLSLREMIESTPIEDWHKCIYNDFEKSVFLSHPELSVIKQTLYDMRAVYASMSGSGSAVYGIFTHPVESGSKVFPDYFTFALGLE